MAESQGINVKQAITDELVLAEIANNCKLAEVTNEPTERLNGVFRLKRNIAKQSRLVTTKRRTGQQEAVFKKSWKDMTSIHDRLEGLGVGVAMVPPGTTGYVQPLDTQVNKTFKALMPRLSIRCSAILKADGLRNVKCYGIAIPNIFNLPYHNPFYLVKTESLTFYQSFATSPGHPLKLLNARVLFRIPHVGVARQVDAVNLVSNLKSEAAFAARWRKIVLNQSRGHKAVVDPLSEIDPTHSRFHDLRR
ncbi:hypothetical protein V8E54_006699 [Elaphomyces granulatus]